jgi:hypothetical protein
MQAGSIWLKSFSIAKKTKKIHADMHGGMILWQSIAI